MPPIFNFDANTTLLDAVRLILVIGVPLAFLTSIGLLSLYRRAVLREMQVSPDAEVPELAPPESPTPSGESEHTPLQINVIDSASRMPDTSTSGGLYRALLHGPRRAAAIYTLAGLCYALVTTLIFLRATKSEFQPLNFLVVFWYYAWPVTITLGMLATTSWWTRLKIFAGYFLIILLLGVIAVIGRSVSSWLQIVLLWLLTNFPAALLLLAFFNRRIRAVGPLVLTFMILAATGLVLLPTFAINIGEVWALLISVGDSLRLGAGGIFTLLFLLGIVAFSVLGWLAVVWIGKWYRLKKISEQSITMDAIWLLFGIFQAVGLIFEGDHWVTVSLMAFAVYKTVAWAGFWLAERYLPANQQHPKLLVLRVFSPGTRSERLFDMLAMHWRSVGSIQLIAGPDLAATTIEPHEFLDFLSGKLARRFIDSSQTLDSLISQMDLRPDYDGQFRVNDFFCHDNTWKMVLSRLVRGSDVVLMDLRGFSSQNAGCIFEINELVNLMPLGQVVFILDDSTDETFLRQVIQQSWEQMSLTSPNRASSSGMPTFIRLSQMRDVDVQRLFQVLAGAAKPGSEIQVLATSSASGFRSP